MRVTYAAFATIKIAVGSRRAHLLRWNPKWKDFNLLGGHQVERDAGSYVRTARRELTEEVPALRQYRGLRFEPLTDVLEYGPVMSKSRGELTNYFVQFFSARLGESPEMLVDAVTQRSLNEWLDEQALGQSQSVTISSLVHLLADSIEGGLAAVPLSAEDDMESANALIFRTPESQLGFRF